MPGNRLRGGTDPTVSWSILLQAKLSDVVDARAVPRRLADATAVHPHLGVPPLVEVVDAGALTGTRARLATKHYREGQPLVRVAVCDDVVLLAAHHSAVDGLGLVALLGIAIDERITSSATGLGERDAGRSFARAAITRLTEALLRPPTRIAPAHGGGTGEHLLDSHLPRTKLGTADLAAAAGAVTLSWNREHGGRTDRIVAAVGASRRGGDHLDPRDASAFLRLRPTSPTDAAELRGLLAAQAPEPDGPGTPGLLTRVATRVLARRLGSSFLVSNLGVVSAGERVRSLSFFPAASGGSAVAFGAATVGETTTVTVRVRERDFDHDSARELLDRLTAR